MKKTLTPILLLLLNGCANGYTFNSNLNAEAIDEYFKVSDVIVYEDSLPNSNFEPKGLVEGESCQIGVNDAPATIVEARTLARRSAADKGANGLIIKTCFVSKEQTQDCVTSALCIGQAINLASSDIH
ncbi:hypothetical protein HQQ94_16725 [Shewanella sp. VB17]|uniref:Rcs stress response system protein RcsF n=1 Tax=Shewanella sp. VB17 TaxID=2739432 RepID=UPI0015675B9D|nr:Rcs stress response system protein RcsF [Shewanella sp. VB17]NRD74833.1 hypothetical protein [Shewanella sp. VB17]